MNYSTDVRHNLVICLFSNIAGIIMYHLHMLGFLFWVLERGRCFNLASLALSKKDIPFL